MPVALLEEFARAPSTLDLVFLHRGGYAIGLAHGRQLTAHKSGTRYVEGRTAARGWSQQRRSRANQAVALVEAVAQHAERILAHLPASAAALPAGRALGGDRTLLEKLLESLATLAWLRNLSTREYPNVTNPRYDAFTGTLARARTVAARIEHP